jgi:hypothetical protein
LTSVKAIQIATFRAAKLRSYWKQVFFMITFPILSLSSTPLCAARKSLLENQLKVGWFESWIGQ